MSHVIPCVCRVRFLADHKSDPVMSSRDIAIAFIMSATPVLKIIAVANDIDEMFLTLEDECLVLYGCSKSRVLLVKALERWSAPYMELSNTDVDPLDLDELRAMLDRAKQDDEEPTFTNVEPSLN